MNIRTLLSTALDAVLPRRERRARTEKRELSEIPLSPTTHVLLGKEIVTVMDYREPAVEDLLRSLKYDRSEHAARLCAEALQDYLREEIQSLKQFSPRSIILSPVPLHEAREEERGFNQIAIVLERLSTEFRNGRLSIVKSVVARIRETAQQTHLSRTERLRNVSGAFALLEDIDLREAHVILIDDVVTTGATLTAAAIPLEETAIPYSLLALGRA